MERYIGDLKGTSLSMSDIDMSLMNRMIFKEHQKDMRKQLVSMQSQKNSEHTSESDDQVSLAWDAEYPIPGGKYYGEKATSPTVMKILKAKLRDEDVVRFPIKSQFISAFKKYYIRWKCAVGSVVSQPLNAVYTRDNSYIR